MQTFIAHADGRFGFPDGRNAVCHLGRSGVIAALDKREGDGATPLGDWPMRRVFFRPDRLNAPQTGLQAVPLRPRDGWCDEAASPLYNLPVTLPFAASHERLWRDDNVYDLIVELGYNDAPVRSGMGSAIFMHLQRPDGGPTEGCVAFTMPDLLDVLRLARPGDIMRIAAS